MKKILIIQTAFIGDVILSTPLIEKLYDKFPNSKIDFVLRKGNESLFVNHPKLNAIFVWDKKRNKYRNLIKILKQIRINNYDYVINLQRFASSGIFTFLSKGKIKIGFDKNPFSFSYKIKISHNIGNNTHEIERNLQLIESITDKSKYLPKLYPKELNYDKIKKYTKEKYICIAPASVWYTKQYPKNKWVELINALQHYKIFLIGAPSDNDICEEIIKKSTHKNIINLSRELSFLDSAALMKSAYMNYVNDSAPMHIASAVNANVTAIYCSTVPSFGFGPLSDNSKIVELTENLDCRPCGLHGKKSCPEGHFNCAKKIKLEQLI